ncbi:hypothetical protein CY35_05G133600 [Sphagnum magellanicum]|nr:hypothetical protein CY35_05G133600 [Sphagnum magellanicum]
MSSNQNRASRCVFVGNIPYDATEEQLVHICEEVGPVVSFRLVLDRETGKPKGYGFCEFRDEETALSARRNLQGYEINGRQLRVDFAENEKGGGGGERNRDQNRGAQGLPPSGGVTVDLQRQVGTGQTGGGIVGERGGEPPLGQSVAAAAAQMMASALGGNQQQFGSNMNGQSMPMANGGTGGGSGDALTNHLAGMSKHQLYEVMVQMKTLVQQNQQQARQVLMANPQLTKALFQAQIMLGMVRPPQMVQPTMQAPQTQQQQGPTAPPPTNLMQQPPLPPQPRPVAAPPSGVPNQIQQTNQLQQFSYQPTPPQQQPLAQTPFQQQGAMVQQGVAVAYPQQQGLPPANQPLPQQQYQMMQPNIGRMGVDMSTGAPSLGQGSMPSGAGGVMPAGPGIGPGGTSQMGRGPGMTQPGQQMVGMVPGVLMNQAPPSSSGLGGMPGGSMHGMGPMVPLAGGHVMGGVNQGIPTGIGAPILPGMGASDSNLRPSYLGPSPGGLSGPVDGGLAAGSGMQPHAYGQAAQHPVPPPPQQQSQVPGELEQQKALLQQVLSLTPEQINSLPPDQRQQVLQLQQALRT